MPLTYGMQVVSRHRLDFLKINTITNTRANRLLDCTSPSCLPFFVLISGMSCSLFVRRRATNFAIPRLHSSQAANHSVFALIRAFSDFKAFSYILIGGFSVRGCYHIKTPNFPLPCGRGTTSLPF